MEYLAVPQVMVLSWDLDGGKFRPSSIVSSVSGRLGREDSCMFGYSCVLSYAPDQLR